MFFYYFFRVPPFYFKPLRPFRNPNGFRCRRQEYDIYRPSMQTCYLENMPVPGQQCWFEHVFSRSRPCWTYEFIFMNCCEQSWENAWHVFFGLNNRCFQLVKGQFTNRIRVIKFLFQFCWDSVTLCPSFGDEKRQRDQTLKLKPGKKVVCQIYLEVQDT